MEMPGWLWGAAAVVLIILNYSAPLLIQIVLYAAAKRIFRKLPDAAVYVLCLLATTALLYPLYLWNIAPFDPEDMDKFDAFDGLLTLCLWAPWYLGIVIAGIVRAVRQIRSSFRHDKEELTCSKN